MPASPRLEKSAEDKTLETRLPHVRPVREDRTDSALERASQTHRGLKSSSKTFDLSRSPSRSRDQAAARSPHRAGRDVPVHAPQARPPRRLAAFSTSGVQASVLEHRAGTEVQGIARRLLKGVYERHITEEEAIALLEEQPELTWLAQCVQRCPLPPCWTCLEAEGACHNLRYMSTEDGRTVDDPPIMPSFVDLASLMVQWRQQPADAGVVSLTLGRRRNSSLLEAERTRQDWVGPHVDKTTGEEFWHCPAGGRSTWGDPGAAAEFLSQVAERLQQALPPAVPVCIPETESVAGDVGGDNIVSSSPEKCGGKGPCSDLDFVNTYPPKLVGAWAYDESAECSISRSACGALHFREGSSDGGPSGALQSHGSWLQASLADRSGRPRGEVRVRYVEEKECEDTAGVYLITQKVAVAPSVGLACAAEVLMELDVGSVVEVMEVVHLAEQQRVRARLDSPAGWISLAETESGYRWAERHGSLLANFKAANQGEWSADTTAKRKVNILAVVDANEPCRFPADAGTCSNAAMSGATPPRQPKVGAARAPAESVAAASRAPLPPIAPPPSLVVPATAGCKQVDSSIEALPPTEPDSDAQADSPSIILVVEESPRHCGLGLKAMPRTPPRAGSIEIGSPKGWGATPPLSTPRPCASAEVRKSRGHIGRGRFFGGS